MPIPMTTNKYPNQIPTNLIHVYTNIVKDMQPQHPT